jgi:hypothetical protein
MNSIVRALKRFWYAFVGDDRMTDVQISRPQPTADYSVRR